MTLSLGFTSFVFLTKVQPVQTSQGMTPEHGFNFSPSHDPSPDWPLHSSNMFHKRRSSGCPWELSFRGKWLPQDLDWLRLEPQNEKGLQPPSPHAVTPICGRPQLSFGEKNTSCLKRHLTLTFASYWKTAATSPPLKKRRRMFKLVSRVTGSAAIS